MAIQISDKHLSPQAKKALNNAVNKSQFLRDAIEYYVRRGEISTEITDSDMRNDIKDIKGLLMQIVTSSENLTVTGKLVNVNEMVTAENEVTATKETETKERESVDPKEAEFNKDGQEEIPSCYDF